jgi:hypothetical protein
MRHAFRIIPALLIIAVLGAAGYALWHTRERTVDFFTDAGPIKAPAESTTPRDILWRPAEPLDVLQNTNDDEYEPKISADGMTLFFVRGRPGEHADIFTCTRSVDGWGEPVPLNAINTEHSELGPEPSADGDALYFYSDRPGGLGGYDLWVSRFDDGAWSAPTNLGPRVNTSFNEYGPALTPGGATLYFASNRPQVDDEDYVDPDAWKATVREDLYERDYDLYATAISEDGLGEARPVDALNSPHNDGAPAVSPFGDFLYFCSDRPGGMGGFDLYRSRLLDGEPGEVENIGEDINTAANELDPALHLGGYGLHFSSNRAIDRAQYDLYQSTSREVFIDHESMRATIDWRMLLPYVPWALLALLLLLLLHLLRHTTLAARYAKLSLLARCLIASALAHVMIMILLGFWGVSGSLSEWISQGAGTRVALVSTAPRDGLAAQLRGEMTDVRPEPMLSSSEQMDTQDEMDAPTSEMAHADAERIEIQREALTAPPVERTAEARDVIDTPTTPMDVTDTPALTFALPDVAAPSHAAETETAIAAPSDAARTDRHERTAHDVNPRVEDDAARFTADAPTVNHDADAPSHSLLEINTPAAASPAPMSAHLEPSAEPIIPAPAAVDIALPELPGAAAKAVEETHDAIAATPVNAQTERNERNTHDVNPRVADDAARFLIDAPDLALDIPALTLADIDPPADRAPAAAPAHDASTEPLAVAAPLPLAFDFAAMPEQLGAARTEETHAQPIAPAELTPTAPQRSAAAVDIDAPQPSAVPHVELETANPVRVRSLVDSAVDDAPAALHPINHDAGQMATDSIVLPPPLDLELADVAEAEAGAHDESNARVPTPKLTQTDRNDRSALDVNPRVEDDAARITPGAPRLDYNAENDESLTDELPPAQDSANEPRLVDVEQLLDRPLPLAATAVLDADSILPRTSEARTPGAVGAVRGVVSDARNGDPIPGALVRLDLAEQDSLLVRTDQYGRYMLETPSVPDFVALSASHEGYTPQTVNVSAVELEGKLVRRDFALHPEQERIIAVEGDPEVHHLGDDAFTGRINSRFQKRSEGRRWDAAFTINPALLEGLPGDEIVTIRLMTRGTQRRNRVRINGSRLGQTLSRSPSDGRFGEVELYFPVDWLQPGENTIQIESAWADSSRSDLDDFEFVNVRIELPPSAGGEDDVESDEDAGG